MSKTVFIEAAAPLRPSGLTVLYDATCPVCRAARLWAERHRQLVPIRFVPAGSAAAGQRFPDLDVATTLAVITAVTNEGAVFRGDRAWTAVFWSVAATRSFATGLTQGRGRRRFRSLKSAAELLRSWSGTPVGVSPGAGPAAGPGGRCGT